MSNIEFIKSHLPAHSVVSPVSGADLASLRNQFVGIPNEYIEFLEKVGYGEVGDIRVYEAPTSPSDIYPARQSDLSGIVLFGDDF